MNTTKRYSPETREQAVRKVFEYQSDYESQKAAMVSISGKIGCTAETLLKWVRRSETVQDKRPGVSSSDREMLTKLKLEIRALKRANKILRNAPAFFDQPPPGFSIQL